MITSLDLARLGEEEASRFLKREGFRILDRNYRIPAGELDIIAMKKKTIVFVEVKTRANDSFAHPWQSVGNRKQNRMKMAAKSYVREKQFHDVEYRFDVVSITMSDALKPQIEWIQNAF